MMHTKSGMDIKIRKECISLILIMILSGIIYIFMPDKCCNILEVLYLLLNIIALYLNKKINGVFINILSIFLFCVFFFNGDRILLDLLGYDDMRELYYFTTSTITKVNNNRAILCVILGTGAVSLAYLRFSHKGILTKRISSFRLSNSILYLLFIIGFAVKIYIAYRAYSLILTSSYLAVFLYGVGIPLYLRVISYFPLFVCLYKLNENKRIWLFPVFLFALLSMATGQRGLGMGLIIIGFYFSYIRGLIRFTLIRFLGWIVSCLIIMILIGQYRVQDEEVQDNTAFSLLWGQGVSLSVLQIAIQDEKQLDYHVHNIFDNVLFRATGSFSKGVYENSLSNQVTKYKLWSSYISYKTNPAMYFSGGGLGGNYFGQMYAAGKELMVMLSSLFVVFFLRFLENNLRSNNVINIYLTVGILQYFILIPRDNLLDFITDMIEPGIALMLIYIIFIITRLAKEHISYGKNN